MSLPRRLPLLAALLAAPLAAHAQTVSGPYVSLGAGVGLQQDEVALANPAIGRPNNNFWSFDPGFAGQVSLGWGFGNGLRAEIEGDFLSNGVSGYGPTRLPRVVGGTEQKYGGMANVLYDIRLGWPVTPYLGVGFGAQAVAQNGFMQDAAGFALPVSTTGDQTITAFAYQAIAGVAWPVAAVPGLSLTAEYRFFGIAPGDGGFDRHAYANTPSGAVPMGSAPTRFVNDFNHSLMLGLRYALWAPPPPPAGTPASAPTPAPAPARTYLVFFDWDSADLNDRARQIIADAAAASTHVEVTRIEVNGHTDASGSAVHNQALSERRAQAVAAELVRDGVAENEIVTRGFGESQPLVPTAAGAREPQNRRVEIILD